MFRKPLPTTGAHKLGGSDEKKLRKQIVAAFPCATEEDAMELVPKKSELSLQKLAAPSRTQIYVGDGQPVFYDASGKGDLFPTVFALWRAPGILGEPVSVLGAPVTKFIVQGADLMLPGVGRVPPIDFGRGRLFAVVVRVTRLRSPSARRRCPAPRCGTRGAREAKDAFSEYSPATATRSGTTPRRTRPARRSYRTRGSWRRVSCLSGETQARATRTTTRATTRAATKAATRKRRMAKSRATTPP
jgi:predicted ribosome-associated RNA-binding protein Tma20